MFRSNSMKRSAVKKRATKASRRNYGGYFGGYNYSSGFFDLDSWSQKYRASGSNVLHLLLDVTAGAEL